MRNAKYLELHHEQYMFSGTKMPFPGADWQENTDREEKARGGGRDAVRKKVCFAVFNTDAFQHSFQHTKSEEHALKGYPSGVK